MSRKYFPDQSHRRSFRPFNNIRRHLPSGDIQDSTIDSTTNTPPIPMHPIAPVLRNLLHHPNGVAEPSGPFRVGPDLRRFRYNPLPGQWNDTNSDPQPGPQQNGNGVDQQPIMPTIRMQLVAPISRQDLQQPRQYPQNIISFEVGPSVLHLDPQEVRIALQQQPEEDDDLQWDDSDSDEDSGDGRSESSDPEPESQQDIPDIDLQPSDVDNVEVKPCGLRLDIFISNGQSTPQPTEQTDSVEDEINAAISDGPSDPHPIERIGGDEDEVIVTAAIREAASCPQYVERIDSAEEEDIINTGISDGPPDPQSVERVGGDEGETIVNAAIRDGPSGSQPVDPIGDDEDEMPDPQAIINKVLPQPNKDCAGPSKENKELYLARKQRAETDASFNRIIRTAQSDPQTDLPTNVNGVEPPEYE